MVAVFDPAVSCRWSLSVNDYDVFVFEEYMLTVKSGELDKCIFCKSQTRISLNHNFCCCRLKVF